MKYIFRYALLTQFTEKENLITKEQLLQALKSVKFSANTKDIDSLVNKHAQCITLLLKTNDKRDLEGVIRESFEKDGLTDNDVSDLMNVWQSEKQFIYKKVLNQNTKSTPNFQGMSWTLKNGVASKSGNLSNSTEISLVIKDNTENFQVSVNKNEFLKLSQSVRSCQQFLNELFQNN